MDYWKECISEALDDAHIKATDEQIDIIAGWIEGAHENYGMAMGYDVASANLSAARKRENDELQQRLNYEQTVPRKRCEDCCGHGFTRDGWGREFGCGTCRGEGSIRLYPFEYRA